MRFQLLALLMIASTTQADDTEDLTNREIADVDFYDQREHDLVVNRAFGPNAYGDVSNLSFIYVNVFVLSKLLYICYFRTRRLMNRVEMRLWMNLRGSYKFLFE